MKSILIPLIGLAVAIALTIPAQAATQKPTAKTLVLAGGCFWCLEGIFEELQGVLDVESGFAGGSSANATYEEVCTGKTGHAEVVKVTYDPAKVSAADLLHIFFTIHDPTTLNRQGNDAGTQYRSAIFFSNDEEKALAKRVLQHVAAEKIWRDPIVTTIEPLKNYIRADSYHQNYWEKYESGSEDARAGMNSGYCRFVIEPKVAKFRAKYASKLKKKN